MGVIIDSIGFQEFEKGEQMIMKSYAQLTIPAVECICEEDLFPCLLVYAGIFRSKYVVEPSVSALINGEIISKGVNPKWNSSAIQTFDLIDGLSGPAKAMQVAAGMLESGRIKSAIVFAGDHIEEEGIEAKYDISDSGSYCLLRKSESEKGFLAWQSETHDEYADMLKVKCNTQSGVRTEISSDENLLDTFTTCSVRSVEDFLKARNIELKDISSIACTDFPVGFEDALLSKLKFEKRNSHPKTFYTSSVFKSIQSQLKNSNKTESGLLLVVSAASGINVSLALYRY